MRDPRLGIVLPLDEDPDTGRVHRWDELRTMARLAEDIGFDAIGIGTWVLSANQRNPGITVRAVETLDEISGGQFVFGLGGRQRQLRSRGLQPPA